MKRIMMTLTLVGMTTSSFANDPLFVPRPTFGVQYAAPTPAAQPLSATQPLLSDGPLIEHSSQFAAPPSYEVYPSAPQPWDAIAPGTFICDACDAPPVLPLYRNVRVRQPLKKHPYAVSKIVSVPDPRIGCHGCVLVEICVPPCACEHVSANRTGKVVKFDYGKYSVNVVSRLGRVVVDYNS